MSKRSALARVERPRRPVPRVGAFFDMDKTIIAENSASMYMKYRYLRGRRQPAGYEDVFIGRSLWLIGRHGPSARPQLAPGDVRCNRAEVFSQRHAAADGGSFQQAALSDAESN